MRIVSLLPSATEILFALGLDEEVVGRSHACDFPPQALELPALTSPGRSGTDAEAGAADARAGRPGAAVRARSRSRPDPIARTGAATLDRGGIRAARPDLVLVGGGPEGGGITRREVVDALMTPGLDVDVVELEATSVEGILHAVTTVGAMTSAEDEAIGLVEILRERLGRIEEQVQLRRAAGMKPRRVVALEWLDPPFGSAGWVPEQVRRAGGWDLLGREGTRAVETSWPAVVEMDPEQVLLIPWGMDARGAAEAWRAMPRPDGWDELRAARHGEVFALDAHSYFSRPGPRVIDGIALLAELFDPQGFVDEAPPDAWIPLGPP